MLFRNLQRLELLKSHIRISVTKNFNKIRNSSNLSTKLIKPNQRFLAEKPKSSLLLISLTLVPPLIPTIYAKEAEPVVDIKVQNIEDEFCEIEDQINEQIDSKPSFTWKELWALIKPNFHYFLAAILGSFAISYLNITIPIRLGELTNQLSKFVNSEFDSNEFFRSIKEPALKLIWNYVLQGLFTTFTITALSNLGENMAVDLKTRLFKSIINQDIEFFDKRRTGEILNVLTSDIQEFKSSFKIFFSQGLRSFTQTIGCFGTLYYISPKMSAFLCILVPNIVFVGSLIGHFLRNISRLCQQQSAKVSAMANEAFSSIRTIKAITMEERETEFYKNEIEELSKLNQKLGLGISIFQGLTNIALNGIVLSCLLFGGHLMGKQEINPGDLFTFLTASQTIQRSISSLSLMTGHYIKYINTGNRIFDFINMQPQITSSNTKLDELIGEINFRNVIFNYPTRKNSKVLDKFSLKVNPGTTIAIVGHSGSGKSTIAYLLERFYDVERGSINIDGVNIKELDLKWLRNQIGYINQEPLLFATTIMENIRYGSSNATDEEVYKAAKLANAHDFIKLFPNSYQTMVGERGVTVSGGQKQRIAIAREILKNPKILILDEATSALDSKSERLITDSLEKLMKGRTVIIIAHRLSTVRNADLIAVISNGKICELGNHDELVKKEGLYYQLIKQQQSS